MPKPKAAIYCRVSTDKQFDKGGSLGTQEKRCREWCKREGYAIADVYKDVYSGGSTNRSQLQRLLRDAGSRPFELIVVTKMDRFTRSLSDYFTKLNEFEKHGIRIYAIDQPEISTEGSTGKLLRNIILTVGEFERDLIRQRTAEGKRQKLPGVSGMVGLCRWDMIRMERY